MSEFELILKILKDYHERYPDIRFGQALINTDIINTKPTNTVGGLFEQRDIYNDTDAQILSRIKLPN